MTKLHTVNKDIVQELGASLKGYPSGRNSNVSAYLQNLILTTPFKDFIKKGDAIVFENMGYRGANVYFWDGKKVVNAGTEYADTGNIPEEFIVQDGKFSPDNWSELIDLSKEELNYQHFTELTLGPVLQNELRNNAAETPCIVRVNINGKEFSFFIQKNESKEDIEDSWFYYTGNNTVVQADADSHGNTDWHPEAQDFAGILQRMRALQGGKRRRTQRNKKNRKATRRSRK